jgi:signal transduction histidine kinase/CheY-like chemotaxis protein
MHMPTPHKDMDARLEYLEGIHRFTADALEMAASLGDFQSSINKLNEPSLILKEAETRVKSLISVEVSGFYLIEEISGDLRLADCQPPEAKETLQEEVEFLIDNGTVAWALRDKRCVTVATRDFKKEIILHVMATYSKIRGLFVGILRPDEKNVPEVSLSLLSIILLNSANTLESLETQRITQKARQDLETRVRERTLNLAQANENLRVQIAEREKAEQVLNQTASLLQNIFEAIPDLLTVYDSNLRVVLSNWPERRRAPDEVEAGMPDCYARYMNRDHPCDPCPTLEVFRTGRPATKEMTIPRLQRILEVNAYPVFEKSGNVRLVTEYVRDITGHRQMQREQLKIAKLESTGILAGGIAHDFNNLLTAILGYIELSKMGLPAQTQTVDYLRNAEKAVTVAQGLAHQLITFADGGLPITRPTPLRDLVTESAELALSGSNVQCKIALADDLWLTKVDPLQMRQVVQNIVLNAREAMPGGGQILIRAHNVTSDDKEGIALPEGDYVKMSIEDHGSGIPEETLSKVFDPYFSTKTRWDQKGMGLGLTVCHSIIEKHGGHICIESQVKQGTTVHIHLPAIREEVVQGTNETVRSHARVLVMEDDEMVRDFVEKALRKLGHEVEPSNNGEGVLKLYNKAMESKKPFDIVILDLTIKGGMGGKETIKELVKIDPRVHAIIASGYSNDPVMVEYKQHGFKGALSKPFHVRELGHMVSKALERAQGGSSKPGISAGQ